MDIFALVPREIWAILHGELVTSLDARSRVNLQRTCKAAHALDPGLILAPAWLDAWHQESTGGHGRIPLLLEVLKQVDCQRIFDWCPPTSKIGFYVIYDEENDCDIHGVSLDWVLRPPRKNKNGVLDWMLTGSLSCQLLDESFRWTLDLYNEDGLSYEIFDETGESAVLEEILANHPRLCHDIPQETLDKFANADIRFVPEIDM
jgi:hypothetical protein